jgi:hypothetical protein
MSRIKYGVDANQVDAEIIRRAQLWPLFDI